MPCLDCLEKRAKVLNAIGLSRFAPDLGAARAAAGVVAPVAIVRPELAAYEFHAPAPILELFRELLETCDERSAKDITFAAVHLIVFALVNSCPDKKCIDEQVGHVCEALNQGTAQRYDRDTGRRREVVLARPPGS